MKKMKKIMAAAIAMMTFSTAAAVTGTVAWFTASNVVTASGMSIQADTEQGINISNESKLEWKESATASHTGKIGENQAAFIPTSTVNGSTWYHANSDDRDSHEAYGAYTTLSVAQNGSTGVYAVTNPDLSITNKNVYLLNSFYLRASIPTPVNASKLYVNLVEASATGSNSTALNKSLRVLVNYVNNTTILGSAIFAPFEDGSATPSELVQYTVGGVDSQTYTPYNEKNVVLAENVTIPAASNNSADAALEIKVFVYFEGEDANCKSANIPAAVLDTLALTCKFGTETIA